MSDMSLTKVADLLDTFANYIDTIEYAKTASQRRALDQKIAKFEDRYTVVTGSSLDAKLRGKLAQLDTDTLEHILKVAHTTSGAPDSLGGSSTQADPATPRTVKEAAARAEDSFLEWIIS